MNSGESKLKVNIRLKQGDFQLCCNAQLPGGVTAVFGPSGSGKTTLTDILMCLLTPDSGEILVDGVAVCLKNRVSWQNKITFVPQNLFLTDGTIKENILFGEEPDSVDEEKLDSIASLLNSTTLENKKADLLLEMGRICLENNTEQSLLYLNQALTLAERSDYQKGLARIYIAFGDLNYWKMDSFQTSLDYYKKALEIKPVNLRSRWLLMNTFPIIYKNSEQVDHFKNHFEENQHVHQTIFVCWN